MSPRRLLPYVFLIIIGLVFLLSGITAIPALDQDESRFMQASKQMLETHNFQQINFQDKPRHLKPPGIYWLQAASTRIFSHPDSINHPWTYRVPSVLGGVLVLIFLFSLFSASLDREYALIASLALISALFFVFGAHVATTDMMLLACIVLMQGGLWHIFSNYRASKKVSWQWPAVFWIGMTAGVLIKGTSPLIGFLTILGVCIGERSLGFLKHVQLAKGIFALVSVSLLWIIPFSMQGHSNFLWDMLRKDALPKILGSAQGHGAPPGYFLILMPLLFWPASILLFRSFSNAWQQRTQALNFFLLSWVLSSWVFIALVHTKLPEYALPLFPGLALMAANLCRSATVLSKRLSYFELGYRVIWLCFTVVLAFVFPVVDYLLLKTVSICAVFIAFCVMSLGVVLLWMNARGRFKQSIYSCLVGSCIIYTCVYQFYIPALKPIWISKKIVNAVTKNALPITSQTPLYSIDFKEPSLVFSLGTHKVVFSSFNQLLPLSRTKKNIFLLLSASHYQQLKNQHPLQYMTWHKLATIEGFNYERGKKRDLVLIEGSAV